MKKAFCTIFNSYAGFVHGRCRHGLLCGDAAGLGFFVSFEMGGADGALPIELEPRISEYLSLMMRLIFAFGLAFELPVVLLLLARAGLVTPDGLAEKRKIAIVVAFVVACHSYPARCHFPASFGSANYLAIRIINFWGAYGSAAL